MRRNKSELDPKDLLKDRKSTRLNSSHEWNSYAVFCLKEKILRANDNRTIYQSYVGTTVCDRKLKTLTREIADNWLSASTTNRRQRGYGRTRYRRHGDS